MTATGITTPTKTPKRLRARTAARKQATPHEDGPLQLALNQLADAIHALCAPQPHIQNEHLHWIDSRYTQLRQAITGQRNGHGRTQPSSVIPLWVDALKLSLEIQTGQGTQHRGITEWGLTTPHQLPELLHQKWRPQDATPAGAMATITNRITAWTKAIDDLFATKPIYLPDPCPQCGQHETRTKLNDEGDRIWTYAIALTADRGAWCQACHCVWPPDHLQLLGRMLGYPPPQGVTA